ncbi:hypothetical protein ACK129_14875 [Pseudomonas citrulli]|uniref:hypothetical protein n=1 Tax=Pseudomonas citrulli TaxID=3064347 RepID=UPI003AC20C27
MTTGQSQKNITYKGCTIDDDGSLDPVWNKVDMLEADDSKRACIPAKLQLADFFQLRQAEIGQKRPLAVFKNRRKGEVSHTLGDHLKT